MDEAKRKMIEAKLQELIAEHGEEKPKSGKSQFNSGRTVTVIRRRRRKPELQHA